MGTERPEEQQSHNEIGAEKFEEREQGMKEERKSLKS